MGKPIAEVLRVWFDFLPRERWENFIVVRNVVEWAFKFVTWNIILATVYAIYLRTCSALVLAIWFVLGYLLVGFVLKFLECIVVPKKYEALGRTGFAAISIHIGLVLALYAAFWALDYKLVTGFIYAFTDAHLR